MTVPRVHIKGLEENGEKEEIRRLFSKFGRLKNVWIATKPPGFAYVFFETFKDAQKAVDYYNGKRVCGITVRVELSPIEDKYRPRPLPPPRRLHPADRRRDESDPSFSDYDSDQGGDYERRHDGYHDRSSRGGNYREGYPSRGRPNSYHRGGSRGGNHSHDRSYSDERRHYPERRGPGRGRSDSRGRYDDDGDYRPRGRSRDDYHGDSFRGRGGGPPDRYHGNNGPKHNDRGSEFRPRENHRHEQYSDSGRGRGHYREKVQYRSHSSRYYSPPPSRHLPEFTPPKRRSGPSFDSEYVAKQYRMKHGKNFDFGESSRGRESQRHDMEYRHKRKISHKDGHRVREREYAEPQKGSHHQHPSSHRRAHHANSKYWESKEIRSRSPLSPSKEYGSPPPYGNSPSSTRSRSHSVSNQSSDTSRGPSATPSPPPHHRHIPSRSPSRSGSPFFPKDVYPSDKFSHSPHEDSNYRSPSPGRVETSKYTSSPPPPPPPPPAQNPERSPSPTFAANSPAFAISPKQDADDFVEKYDDEQQIEMEQAKKYHHEYKKIKREVRDRDRDRQISYKEKSSKQRYVDHHHEARIIRDRDDKIVHSRPLSESFDIIGSSHSSEHLSPPPPRRPRGEMKRRSSRKEEYVANKIFNCVIASVQMCL